MELYLNVQSFFCAGALIDQLFSPKQKASSRGSGESPTPRGDAFCLGLNWSTWNTVNYNSSINTNQVKSKSNVGFSGKGKTGVPGEKPLRSEYRTNKPKTYMTTSLGI